MGAHEVRQTGRPGTPPPVPTPATPPRREQARLTFEERPRRSDSCPKCGWDGLTSNWTPRYRSEGTIGGAVAVEWIEWECVRCGYVVQTGTKS